MHQKYFNHYNPIILTSLLCIYTLQLRHCALSVERTSALDANMGVALGTLEHRASALLCISALVALVPIDRRDQDAKVCLAKAPRAALRVSRRRCRNRVWPQVDLGEDGLTMPFRQSAPATYVKIACAATRR